ncbi:unnamed protein product, partial [Ilex paraguariensis]
MQIFRTVDAPIEWEEHNVGQKIDPRNQSFRTWESLELVQKIQGYHSLNFTLRKELNLYANVRPCCSLPGYKTWHDDVTLITIHENTEGEYSGLEHQLVRAIVESLKIITCQASLRVA